MSALAWWMNVRASVAAFWDRCRQWANPRPLMELAGCGEEVERIATDFRMSASEFRALASQGPHAADLLPRRMAALNLDRTEVARTYGRVFQDLQRVCIMCEHHRRCMRDLVHDSAIPAWKDYCPNAPTLMVLDVLPWTSRKES